MDPSIRPATEADVPRMIDVARRAFLSAFGPSAPFILIQQWIREDRESVSYPRDWDQMYVLEQDGVVAGLMQPIADEINGIWVHPDYQGRGVGSRLMDLGEKIIADQGYGRSWLTCSSYNRRALEFYRHRGYTVFKSLRHLHECGVDEESFAMERQLGGSR